MRQTLALAAAVVFSCGLAVAQTDDEPQLNYSPVAVFNQHLYLGAFQRPKALAFDRANDEVWVADAGNAVVSVHAADGAELYAFTSKKYAMDPVRIAMRPGGGIALVDGARASIRTFDYRGRYKGDLKLDGLPAKALIGAIAFDGDGNVYVGENRSRQVFVFRPDGSLKFQFGSPGSDEGQFESIGGMTVGADGTVYVIDQRALAVQVFDREGNFVRGWGKHEMGGANFSLPSGIAVDSVGRILVSDELRHTVKVFSPDGRLLTQIGGLGDGIGQLAFPTDVAVDQHDRVYISERSTARVQVFALK